MRRSLFVLTLLLIGLATTLGISQDKTPAPDKAQQETAALEAQLGKLASTTPQAAEAMLKLMDLYYANANVFGLNRVAQTFVSTHSSNPRHAEVMVKLLDGLRATSRNKEIVVIARQFLVRYPTHASAGQVEEILAKTLSRMGDRSAMAEAYEAVWKRQGPTEAGRESGVLAMQHFASANNAPSYIRAAQLGETMLDRLPAGTYASEVGRYGVVYFESASEWVKANLAGVKLLAKAPPTDKIVLRDLHSRMGENYARANQRANAVESFKKAVALGDNNPALLSRLITELHSMNAKAPEMEPWVTQYMQKYADRPDRFVLRGYLGHGYLRSMNKPAALAIFAEILPFDARSNDAAGAYVRENGNMPAQAAQSEQVLRNALAKNVNDGAYLRYYLAFEIYRNYMKDNNRCRAMLRELIASSPSNDTYTTTAIDWLLSNPPNDGEFKADLAAYFKLRKERPEFGAIRSYLAAWITQAEKAKLPAVQVAFAKSELATSDRDPIFQQWQATEQGDRNQIQAARAFFLAPERIKTLSESQAKPLLWAQANEFRHETGNGNHIKAIGLFGQLAARFPKDYTNAQYYFLSASDYGSPEVAKEAMLNMLKMEPEYNDTDVWRRMFTIAETAKSAELIKQTFTYITKSQLKHGFNSGYASFIGDVLDRNNLKAEALEYWKKGMTHDRLASESRTCAERLLFRLTKPEERIKFILDLLPADSDSHGTYATWLADEYLKAKDLANFEKVLRDSKTRQKERSFRAWGVEDHPMHAWINTWRGDKEAKPADKIRVFTVLRDLQVPRQSALAELSLLELPEATASLKPMQRLLAIQNATLLSYDHPQDWDYLTTYVQTQLAGKDYAAAATLASAMLSNLPSMDPGRRKSGLDMVRQSYARMGGLGLNVDENSPLAPLYQAALYLRLGDDRLALEAYTSNKALFDQHRTEVPVDLLLFVCENHIAAGGDENHNRAEDILRSWLIKNGEVKEIEDQLKAKVQLLLAKNFYKSQRFDVARSEFQSLMNRFAKTPQAIEAEFGIGESYMAQKVYDQAQLIFEKLANNPDRDTSIRAEFLRGVLANRRGDRDEARTIFRTVLERVPNIELANETLFHLAEVYGAEQRYMDQLELLRTVGRLGRNSKRFHTPGMALSIVVQDSDLGISRGHAKIPVKVTTVPGGDEEIIYLRSGGAGKGLFRADLETRLGKVGKNDRILQLTGNDTIKCDYPEEFKKEFKTVPLPDAEIKIAASAKLEMGSSKIIDKEEETFAQRLQREAKEQENPDKRVSQVRPQNQVKPGNLVFLRVQDADRDLTDEADKVMVKLVAASGDQIQVQMTETGPHTGIFEGTAKTGELPAGALASDSAIDHSPVMAIDQEKKTFWLSQPDGATPKWLAVDMKDLKKVDHVTFTTPDEKNHSPVRVTLEGSNDGRFWFRLGTQPVEQPLLPIVKDAEQSIRLYEGNYTGYTNWNQIVELSKAGKPLEKGAVTEQIAWSLPETDMKRGEKYFAGLWCVKIVQPKAGAARIAPQGITTGLVLDGKLELPLGKGDRTVDVWLEKGIHDLYIFAAGSGQGIGATWSRADQNAREVVLNPFRPSDFDLKQAEAKPADLRKPAEVKATGPIWDFSFAPIELRHLRLMIHEYRGEAVAINHVEIQNTEAKKTLIPPEGDILSLANNDVLEIAAGDTITANYVDEVTETVDGGSRLLNAEMTATYFNAHVTPIAYDFVRQPGGEIVNVRKELIRIDPGERLIVEVTDYDQDRTAKPDQIKIEVAVNDGKPIELTAQETLENSGIFTKEVDTSDKDEEGKLKVKPGDRVYCRYLDAQNTFPGHSVVREAVVYVNDPSEGRIRILETRAIRQQPQVSPDGKVAPEGPPQIIYLNQTAISKNDEKEPKVAQVAFEAPLTIEVIDRDAAKDSRSKVTVQVTTTDGAKIDVECMISGAFTNASGADYGSQLSYALLEGRFIGQVVLQLGGKNSPDIVPVTANMPRGLIGGAKLTKEEGAGDQALVTRVLNLAGKDVIEATYVDARRPDAKETKLQARGRVIANGTLVATDSEYKNHVTKLHVGERLYLQVIDPDRDLSDERDKVKVEITTNREEKETLELIETLAHSGIFTGSVALKPQDKPTPGNLSPENPAIECYFGDKINLKYVDEAASTETGKLELTLEIPVVIGTDGLVTAFSRTFNDEKLAVETQFTIAESYFELFKNHRTLKRTEEQKADLESGRRVLRDVMENYPNPKYVPRIAYLLGQFAQELQQWTEAIDAYQMIVRQYPDNSLAADAQYKLAQCYEEAGDFDQALEAYVTLAATYPKSPLIANVMVRISDHFYKKENYKVAAQVGEKFLERFEGHKWAPKMAFRVGQCFYKNKEYVKAGEAFDRFAKIFPEDALSSDSLFWSGESYRMGSNMKQAFVRYNKCRWDHPASEAAKYARGRLALPEMLQQFEAAAGDLDK